MKKAIERRSGGYRNVLDRLVFSDEGLRLFFFSFTQSG